MQLVERPLRLGGHGALKASVLATLMAGAGGVGYFTFAHNGLENRFPPETRELTRHVDFKWAENVRTDQCHLQDRNLSKHAEVCYETGRPLVALWGDSHAASLYPGLRKLQADHPFGVMQLTQAGCPPVFGVEKLVWFTGCNAVNARIFQDLVRARPEVLILTAAWVHEDYPMTLEALAAKFAATAREIKAQLPGTRVLVIGPVPRWKDSPQKTAFLAWKQALDKTRPVPALLPASVLGPVEDVLSGIARENGFEYVSAVQELCEGTACLSRVGERAQDFIAVDAAHLSRQGAEFFVARLASRILGS
jgi:hypothetical protein